MFLLGAFWRSELAPSPNRWRCVSRTKRALAGFAASVVQYGLLIALQAILTPMVLRVAGQETLGAFAILMQAIGFLALSDMGLALGLSRELSQAFGTEGGDRRFASILGSGRTLLLGANLVQAIGVAGLAMALKPLFHFSAEVQHEAALGLYALAAWIVIRTILQPYSFALIAAQELAARNILLTLAQTLRLVLSLAAVWEGLGLIGLIGANVLAEMVDFGLCAGYYTRRGLPRVLARPDVDSGAVARLFHFGLGIVFVNLSYRLIFSSGTLVSGVVRGATAASIFYATQMPALVGWNLVHRVADNGTPAINQLLGLGDFGGLRRAFLRLHRITLLLLIPLVAGLVTMNGWVIRTWVGNAQYAGEVASLSLAAFACSMCVAHVSNAFIIAAGRLRVLATLAVAEGLSALVLSIVLGRLVGLGGIFLGTALADIPVSLCLHSRAQKIVGVSYRVYFRECVWPALKAGAPIGLSLVALRSLTRVGSPLGIGVGCAAVGGIGILAIWRMGLSHAERREALAALSARSRLST